MTTPTPHSCLQSLLTLIAEECPTCAYYHGRPDLTVLRTLVAAFPPAAVQAMDMNGRLTQPERIEFFHHGVTFWDEGGHATELSVRDTPFYDGQLRDMVKFPRPTPRLFFLFDGAVNVDQHDSYLWEWRGEYLIGKQKDPNLKLKAGLEWQRIQRLQSTRAMLRHHGYAVPLDEYDTDVFTPNEEPRIPAGAAQVTSTLWARLPAEERERRERGATLLKHRLAEDSFYGDRAKKSGGDKYWAELFDGFEE